MPLGAVLPSMKALREAGVAAKLFPTPPQRFPGCSISIAISSGDLECCLEVLERNGLDPLSIAHCNSNPVREFYEDTGN
jgi:hypothetical protein